MNRGKGRRVRRSGVGVGVLAMAVLALGSPAADATPTPVHVIRGSGTLQNSGWSLSVEAQTTVPGTFLTFNRATVNGIEFNLDCVHVAQTASGADQFYASGRWWPPTFGRFVDFFITILDGGLSGSDSAAVTLTSASIPFGGGPPCGAGGTLEPVIGNFLVVP